MVYEITFSILFTYSAGAAWDAMDGGWGGSYVSVVMKGVWQTKKVTQIKPLTPWKIVTDGTAFDTST